MGRLLSFASARTALISAFGVSQKQEGIWTSLAGRAGRVSARGATPCDHGVGADLVESHLAKGGKDAGIAHGRARVLPRWLPVGTGMAQILFHDPLQGGGVAFALGAF